MAAITVLKWANLSLTVSTEAIMTFTDYNRKVSYKTEAQDNGTNKPKTLNKGPDLETLSISVELMATLGVDVNAVVKAWTDAANGGEASILYIGGVREGKNKWQVKDVTISNVVFQSNVKNYFSASMQINFVEWYAKGATKSDKKSSSSKKKKPASTTVNNSTTTNPTQQGQY